MTNGCESETEEAEARARRARSKLHRRRGRVRAPPPIRRTPEGKLNKREKRDTLVKLVPTRCTQRLHL